MGAIVVNLVAAYTLNELIELSLSKCPLGLSLDPMTKSPTGCAGVSWFIPTYATSLIVGLIGSSEKYCHVYWKQTLVEIVIAPLSLDSLRPIERCAPH